MSTVVPGTPVVLLDDQTRLSVLVLGPWVIGAYADIFLQGILMTQFYNYFKIYTDDNLGLKLSVWGLAGLTIAKSVQSFVLIWIQNVVFFGNQQGAILLSYTAWWQAGNPLMVAFIGLYVQTYFCYRLRLISKSWIVVIPIAVILLFAFISIILATVFIYRAENSNIAHWFAAHLGSVFVGDILMTFTTAFFLIRTKKSVLPQTVGIITALIRLTFQTAAPAAVCAMMNLILSQVFVGTDNLMSTAFNMALPKLYAVSMMYVLNSRRSLRAVKESSGGYSSGSMNMSTGQRVGRSVRANNDVELGNFAVNVHRETTRAVDVRDMMFNSDLPKSGHEFDDIAPYEPAKRERDVTVAV